MTRTHPEPLLEPIRQARARRDEADAALRNAIIDAMERRGSVTAEQIAEAAGVTRIRVYQIVQEGRR